MKGEIFCWMVGHVALKLPRAAVPGVGLDAWVGHDVGPEPRDAF